MDILYTKVGATYGRPALIDTKVEFSVYVSVALLKPKTDIVNPTFLREVLAHPVIKRQADRSVKGAGVPDLHLIEIKKFLVPVPPLKTQLEFITRTK
jgi:type I restriction enzyme S subunit